jgi:thiol-disulfide isomerase/thioredoxin
MKPKDQRRSRVLASLAVMLSFLSSAVLADPPKPSAPTEKLSEGRDLYDEGKYKEAVKAFKEADKLANGSCAECRLRLARSFNKLGAFKDALKNADSALGMTSDKDLLAGANNERGIALVGLGGKDPKTLEQAEKAFRQVLELSGGQVNSARFSLGVTLLRLSRDEEGVALLKEYLERGPSEENEESAKGFIANPVRARKRLVPDFELVTLAGDSLTAEHLRGKALLLDFWGTWCPPCVAAIPSLISLSRREKDEPFVIVSISTDAEEKTLREFVAKNQMAWPQVWDKEQAFTHKWGIHSFPTYVVVSSEGEIIYTISGWGEPIERNLYQQVYSAIRAARKSAKPAG